MSVEFGDLRQGDRVMIRGRVVSLHGGSRPREFQSVGVQLPDGQHWLLNIANIAGIERQDAAPSPRDSPLIVSADVPAPPLTRDVPGPTDERRRGPGRPRKA